MLLEENQISFHSEDGIIDGIKDYSHRIAAMIGLGSDAEFSKAGVSFSSFWTVFQILASLILRGYCRPFPEKQKYYWFFMLLS